MHGYCIYQDPYMRQYYSNMNQKIMDTASSLYKYTFSEEDDKQNRSDAYWNVVSQCDVDRDNDNPSSSSSSMKIIDKLENHSHHFTTCPTTRRNQQHRPLYLLLRSPIYTNSFKKKVKGIKKVTMVMYNNK